MVESSEQVKQNEPQEETSVLRRSCLSFNSMVSDVQDELFERPEKNRRNAERVQKLSEEVSAELNVIQDQLDGVSKKIQEQILTEENPDGFLLGQSDDYTQYLVLQKDQLRDKFRADKTNWDEAVEMAEKEKAAYEAQMEKMMAEI